MTRKEGGGGTSLRVRPRRRPRRPPRPGRPRAVQRPGAGLTPEGGEEGGRRYAATADDAAFATFKLDGPAGEILAQFNSSWAVRVYRDDLLQIQGAGPPAAPVATPPGFNAQPRADPPPRVWNPAFTPSGHYH